MARVEAYSCACGEIKSLAHCLDTIKDRFLVRLNEVIVRANLDGTVALVV